VSEQLREGDLVCRFEVAHWGLVPVWSKEPKAGAGMINIRTVTEDPSSRTETATRRKLIPANGY
jgi:putative SOS response-associated peptidase YedK